MTEPPALRRLRADDATTTWLPDLLYTGDGRFERGLALVCDSSGRITRLARESEITGRLIRLHQRALLPGLINAHSHAFQRVIRGRTERRSAASSDSFWTWREAMYAAALRLTPEDIYDASRMAFLEMACSGITAVGEFHYLHRTPAGGTYDDPNLLAKAVVRAARDVGLRIALLRVAYARSGHQLPLNSQQARFIEADPETYLSHVERLRNEITDEEPQAREQRDLEATRHDVESRPTPIRRAWVGVAPHSVRAVPLEYLRLVCAFADEHQLPAHIHIAEQPAEVSECLAEYQRTPVALLASEGLLSARLTAIHAVYITEPEAHALAQAGTNVCACPTTERNLGDGIVPADLLFKEGVHISLGTDSQTQIDLLEDARELEYHLRLKRLARNVLAPPNLNARDHTSTLAARLFQCATVNGAQSIGFTGGELAAGRPADFFTVSLNDPSIAGAVNDDLLSAILFSLARTAIREVIVGGRAIVEDGKHRATEEIVERFTALQRRLWRTV